MPRFRPKRRGGQDAAFLPIYAVEHARLCLRSSPHELSRIGIEVALETAVGALIKRPTHRSGVPLEQPSPSYMPTNRLQGAFLSSLPCHVRRGAVSYSGLRTENASATVAWLREQRRIYPM